MAKVKSAINKLKKNDYTIEENGSRIYARQEGSDRSITIVRNGGDYSDDIAVIDIRCDGLEDNSYTDYHAGTFADNISQAIRITRLAQ